MFLVISAVIIEKGSVELTSPAVVIEPVETSAVVVVTALLPEDALRDVLCNNGDVCESANNDSVDATLGFEKIVPVVVVVRGKFAEDAVTVVAIFDEDLDVVSASTLDATLVALEVLTFLVVFDSGVEVSVVMSDWVKKREVAWNVGGTKNEEAVVTTVDG